jgi:hypothetical protein
MRRSGPRTIVEHIDEAAALAQGWTRTYTSIWIAAVLPPIGSIGEPVTSRLEFGREVGA